MKKFVLISLVIFALYSCKSTYNRAEESPLKGEWMVSNVTYSQTGIKVKSFDLADAQCFKNSTWNFVPNNHTGNFTLNGGGSCPTLSENITWYIDNNNQFNMKFVNNEKAKNVADGYNLNYVAVSETSFQLIQNASLEGKPIQIKYEFSKN